MKLFNWIFPLHLYIAPFWGAVIGAGAALLGGSMSNKANAKQASTDREWQRENAQNAHQYQVADMRSAGLNPILSATGGTGAKASGGSSLGAQSDIVTPAVATALAARRHQQENKLMKEQTDKTTEESKLAAEMQKTERFKQINTHIDTQLKNESAHTQVESQKLLREQQQREKATAELTSATAKSAQVEAEMDTSDLGKKLKWTNRTTEAAEGATSAVRSAVNPFHGPARRRNRK